MGAAKARRLRKGREFDTAYREGTVVSGPFFVLRHRANGLAGARWGFAVGKKMAPSSVVRNQLRRRLRAASRSVIVEGADIVLTTRPSALKAPFANLERELSRMVVRAGIGKVGDR